MRWRGEVEGMGEDEMEGEVEGMRWRGEVEGMRWRG